MTTLADLDAAMLAQAAWFEAKHGDKGEPRYELLHPPKKKNPPGRWTPHNARQRAALDALRAIPSAGAMDLKDRHVEDAIPLGVASESGLAQELAEVVASRPAKLEKVAVADVIATEDFVKREPIAAVIQALDDPTGPFARPGYLPVVVRRADKLYLQDGHHRLLGLLLLGHTTMEAMVVEDDETKAASLDAFLERQAVWLDELEEKHGSPDRAGYHLLHPGAGRLIRDKNFVSDSEREAKALRQRASDAEESVTKTLVDIATRRKLKMEGLGSHRGAKNDYRLKSEKRLAEKIREDAIADDLSIADAAGAIGDALRYTMIEDDDPHLAAAQDGVLAELRARGHKVIRYRNYWAIPKPLAYRGINIQMESPDGMRYELQFHTPESFDMKQTKTHPILEKMRSLPPKSAMWTTLNQEMVEMVSSLHTPLRFDSPERLCWPPCSDPIRQQMALRSFGA